MSRRIAFLAILSFLFAACSSGGDVAVTETVALPQEVTELAGPLRSAGRDANAALAAIEDERKSTLQQSWQACAVSKGLELPPAPVGAVTPDVMLADTAFARDFGFGISTLAAQGDLSAEANILAAMAAMEPESAEAFQDGFFGASTLPFLPGFVPGDETNNGGVFLDEDSCYGAGLRSADEQLAETYPDAGRFLPIGTAALDAYFLYVDDARTAEIFEKVTACVEGEGYSPPAPGRDGIAAISGTKLDDFAAQHGLDPAGWAAEVQQEFDELQQQEKDLAVTALACESEHRAELAAIYAEVEQKFLEDNPGAAELLTPAG